ncbi:ABC transporter substrate-binding protein [Pelobacter propionicus]|uniref:ABC transporter substrate binding protein n=1 Tax=Pelobacter propionicus (strain DSM 2379 / NBRC 103807 / OttBd1) TaxID=338966 RepID=A1AN45_PELPD|nr:ABC transporter substrate binding protein [Pelobacter propionicus]ABK98765.1 conserved hypothetical protein [Pelobacter propionicus DSM 2379]
MPYGKTTLLPFLLLFLLLGTLCPAGAGAGAAPYRVLVVMSYHETQPLEEETRKGIESVLQGKAELHYVYLDTKYNSHQGKEKAATAYALYRELRPDGVIAADDDAQALFVVPFLRNRVTTPVMFCGVNAEPDRYGYPARNVSGIRERSHISESIAFLQQLVPSVRRIAFMASDDAMGKILKSLVEREAQSYSATSLPVRLVTTLGEAKSAALELRQQSDALLLFSMASIRDAAHNHPNDRQIFSSLSRQYGKPVIGTTDYMIRHGLLCAVVNSGREQGATAARMLLRAMDGTAVSRIPLTSNYEGKRMINVTVMKSLGIRPRPIVLRGVELVNTAE